MLPELERHHDVLAPTLPGHAGGPPLDGEITRTLLAEAVEQAMDDAGFKTAHIVGNSLGGYVALQLAARGRADSVVALAPGGGWAEGDESYKETLDFFPALQQQVRAIAPRAEALLASPQGRRRATELTTVNFEHIPAELLVHQTHAVAACEGVVPMNEYVKREGHEPRRGEDRLPGARRVGHRGQDPPLAVGRRALPRRLAPARRLGRAGGRRPLPPARHPGRDRAADRGLHGSAPRYARTASGANTATSASDHSSEPVT